MSLSQKEKVVLAAMALMNDVTFVTLSTLDRLLIEVSDNPDGSVTPAVFTSVATVAEGARGLLGAYIVLQEAALSSYESD